MALDDFTYPVVRDPEKVNGVTVTPGTLHNKAWWENDLFGWITKLTQHPDYRHITPADLIKLYMDNQSASSSVYQYGYVYSYSTYVPNTIDNTSIYIYKLPEEIIINGKYYFFNTTVFNLENYRSFITFSQISRYKKIIVGLALINEELTLKVIQSSFEYATSEEAILDNSLSINGIIALASIIVTTNPNNIPFGSLSPITQENITNIGYASLSLLSNYDPIIKYSENVYNKTTSTSKSAQQIIDHIDDTTIHGDSETLTAHINNSSLHVTQEITDHLIDTTKHYDSSLITDHIANLEIHGGGGGTIDDTVTDIDSTWSSSKIVDYVGGIANIDDSSYGADITWSADKISTELAQITSGVDIISSNSVTFVPQITEIITTEGIFIEDMGNGSVRLSSEQSLSWETTLLANNTQIGIKKIFGRKGRLYRISLLLENKGSGSDITFDIFKNGTSILSQVITCSTHNFIYNLQLSNTTIQASDIFECRCINAGTGASNVFCQLTIV